MTNAQTRVAVIGTGAIGASVAADMARAGVDVTFIDQWPAHVEAIRRDGIQVRLGSEIHRVGVRALHLCELAGTHEQFDVVMIGVKAYDTRWTAELIRRHLRPSAMVMGLQNGLCDEDIAEVLGADRTIGCVVELAAEVFDPGVVVRHTPADKTWFGVGAREPSQVQRVQQLAALLSHGARVSILDDVRAAKWTKLVANAVILGPAGMVGTTIARAFALEGMRQLAAGIGREAIAVGRASGFDVQPVFGLTASEVAGDPAEVARILVDTIIGHIGPNARSAVMQDHLKHRYSEVDAINGVIAARGRASRIPTPCNDAIVEMTRRIWMEGVDPCAANLPAAIELAQSRSSGLREMEIRST